MQIPLQVLFLTTRAQAGYVVVPEFGMLAAVVMAASMAGIIGFARYRKA